MAIRWELPEDVLADVLRRVPPRGLAMSRCVCRAWREAVDARRLLPADLLPRSVRDIFMNYCTLREAVDARRLLPPDLLPRSVHDIFMNYCTLDSPEFFSRPTTGPAIWGDLDFIPGFSEVKDHCNSLLLIDATTEDHYYVANPATRRWARLPRLLPASSMGKGFERSKCLVF